MTPYELGVLLHYYSRVGDHPDLERQPPVWQPTIEQFVANGLLRETLNVGVIRDSIYVLTERGRAYLDAVQRVPLPEQRWMMPPPYDALDPHEGITRGCPRASTRS